MNARSLLALLALAAMLLTTVACTEDDPVYADGGNNGAANNGGGNNTAGGNNTTGNNTPRNNTPSENSGTTGNNSGTTGNNDPSSNNSTPGNNSTPANNSAPGIPVGTACETNLACGPGGVCITQLPGGYCSMLCDPNAADACPGGDVCLETPDTAVCVKGCAADTACRDGYACATWLPEPFCAPVECRTDADCASGRMCGRGVCGDPAASVGDGCEAASDCPPGGTCIPAVGDDGQASGFGGGYCTITGCVDDADCGEGGACIEGDTGRFCLATCDEADPCREGYTCLAPFGLVGVPPLCTPGDCIDNTDCSGRETICENALCGDPDADLGDPCRSNADCASGQLCILPDNDDTRGFIGGYCTSWGCDPLTSGSCGEDGVCIEVDANGSTLCLEACEEDDDCREGGLYTCRLAYEGLPEESTACLPLLCASDDDCPNNRTCQEQVCTRR